MPAETQQEMRERTNWGTLLTPDLLRPQAPHCLRLRIAAVGPPTGVVRRLSSACVRGLESGPRGGSSSGVASVGWCMAQSNRRPAGPAW